VADRRAGHTSNFECGSLSGYRTEEACLHAANDSQIMVQSCGSGSNDARRVVRMLERRESMPSRSFPRHTPPSVCLTVFQFIHDSPLYLTPSLCLCPSLSLSLYPFSTAREISRLQMAGLLDRRLHRQDNLLPRRQPLHTTRINSAGVNAARSQALALFACTHLFCSAVSPCARRGGGLGRRELNSADVNTASSHALDLFVCTHLLGTAQPLRTTEDD
jgi:hypothetical protein